MNWLGIVGLGVVVLTIGKELADRFNAVSTKYVALENALRSERWQDADRETMNIILSAAEKNSQIALAPSDLDRVSCEVLRELDQLWMRNSANRFGFSVQKKIYREMENSIPGFSQAAVFEAFRDRVEWRVNDIWIPDPNITFSNSPPSGHFPHASFKIGFLNLVQKLTTCRL
ncbi:MAG: hypothetical protein OHK0035_19830 [Cyanobacteria bacterium J069]